MLYLDPQFELLWREDDPFTAVESLRGTVYREVKSRRTLRFALADRYYFAKIHRGIGWREIFKDLAQLRAPVLGARNEWQAISHLGGLRVNTMTAVAYGERGWNPATRQSFIITEELADHTDLEAYCADWSNSPPGFRHKQSLLHAVATIARRLHRGGVCHRDFYLCHFLRPNSEGETPAISVIDLHRALIKPQLGTRWKVKDLSGLYFSAMDIGLTRRDLLRFISLYSERPWREALSSERGFWQKVVARAEKMYRKHNR
jgi:heptose I phosphotransferase